MLKIKMQLFPPPVVIARNEAIADTRGSDAARHVSTFIAMTTGIAAGADPCWRGLAVRAGRYPAKRHGLQARASEDRDLAMTTISGF
jgi:hypothetical protein